MGFVTDPAANPEPETAEALMRSRFEAFRTGDAAWLLRTWHPTSCPAMLELDAGVRWRGLQIVDAVDGAAEDDQGVVEFRATYLDADGRPGLLHERSRFVREGGRWFYLDGAVFD